MSTEQHGGGSSELFRADDESSEHSPRDILVVDDDESNLTAIEATLGDIGRNLVKARSGREALRYLLHQDFALILLDVQMPEMDGFETAELIRARRRNEHTPIIFVTAYNRNEREVMRGYRLGAVDFLFKPIVPEVLKAKASVFVTLQEQTEAVRRQANRLREMERRESLIRLAEERQKWESDRLREENQRKDEFLAMLAHELRNPLSSVVGGLALMEELGLPNDAFDNAHGSMGRQASHLVRLVDDLLDLSRISRGKVSLARELIDLRDAVEQAVEGRELKVESEELELVVELPEEPVGVDADLVRLVQVFGNLIDNAIQHSDPGGRIAVEVHFDAGHATVRVTDEGRGIDRMMLDQLFDLFAQGSPESGGLGLGLTIAHRLIGMHGGTISAESEGVGHGASFTVELPLTAMSDAEASDTLSTKPRLRDYRVTPHLVHIDRAENGESRAESPPRQIAIVDDDGDSRELLKMLLETWGYDVEMATDGVEGVELVVRQCPDVVLMDVGMPRMDGYEAARQIRNTMKDSTPRLVAMTGYGGSRDRERAREAGFEEHLVKPVYPDDLKAVLKKERR